MWQEILTWVVPCLALGTALWQIVQALRKNVVKPEDLARYSTTADLLGVHKTLQDQVDEGDKALVQARHEIELLKRDVENLPTHKHVQELRDDIGELKTGQAENSTKLDGVTDKIDMLRETVGRVDEFLRIKN